MAFSDLFDYFGSPHASEVKNTITLSGLHIGNFLRDVDAIWKNSRVTKNLFQDVRKYRISFDRFYAPDIQYLLEQITEFKNRKSSKYRIKQLINHLLNDTWLKSTTEDHEDILDFTQLRRLKHTLFDHQITTLKAYNEKVPKMQLDGFLLATPPGCLLGKTIVYINRSGVGQRITLKQAYDRFNQLRPGQRQNWDLSIPTYVRSYTGNGFELHELDYIVYSGIQDVYRVMLENDIFVDCTSDSPIMTDNGFMRACDIVGCHVMCDQTYHKGLHAGSHNKTPVYKKALSIIPIGCHPTYDIICKPPYFNFIANDVVMHNSGKTIMSIALSVCLHADVSFYIVPKSTVTTVWFDGIMEELGPNTRIWASTHDAPLTENYDYYIFHYEALPLALYIAKKLAGRRQKPFIAIDESHNLNEITSIRTLRLIELSKILNCNNTVFATGTPVKALGLEMVPLLRAIDPMFTPSVEGSFKAIFGATAKRANDILRNRLGLISHKIPEDSYMTIPPPKQLELKIKIPNPERFTIKSIQAAMKKFMEERYRYYRDNMKQYVRIYDQGIAAYEKTLRTSAQHAELRQYKENVKIIIEGYDPIAHREIAKFVKEFETQKIIPTLPLSLKNQFKDAVSVVKYAKLKVMGEALSVFAKKRAECAAELARYGKIEDIVTNADKKTIIFSSFIPALQAANEHFTELGFKTLQIFGEFTKDLAATVNKFKQDPDANPLLATLQSLSASQTLTIANIVVFLDVPFRDYIFEQAFHRVFRMGQDIQTFVFILLLETGSEPNISTRSQDILKWSQEQVEAIAGNADRAEINGIVKRLHLNPPSGVEMLLGMLKGLFGK